MMFCESMMLGGQKKAAYAIENSIRLDGVDDYLSRMPTEEGNRRVWTFSTWVKRAKLGSFQAVFRAGTGPTTDNDKYFFIAFNSTDQLQIQAYTLIWRTSSQVFRDTSAWLHIVVSFDSVHQQIKAYVNGTEITAWDTNVTLEADFVTAVNGFYTQHIGAPLNPIGGYVTQPVLVDGQVLDATTFGESDAITGSWVPKEISGIDFGTNGFYLGAPWDASDLGKDYGTTLTATAFDPTTTIGSNVSFSNSDRTVTYGPGVSDGYFPVKRHLSPTGKYHVEFTVSALSNIETDAIDGATAGLGLIILPALPAEDAMNNAKFGIVAYQKGTLDVIKNGSILNTYSGFEIGDRLTIEIDMTAGSADVRRNDTLVTSVTSITIPTDPILCGYSSNALGRERAGTATYNFGQTAFLTDVSNGFTGVVGGNDYTPVSLGGPDVVIDTPSNNYATWNNLLAGQAISFSQGDCTLAFTGSTSLPRHNAASLSFDIANGSGYVELTATAFSGLVSFGLCDAHAVSNADPVYTTGGCVFNSDGNGQKDGSTSAYGSAWSAGNVISIAWKNGSVWWAVNGSWQNSGNPAAGLTPAYSGLSGRKVIVLTASGTGITYTASLNCGQTPFAYTPPSGFKSLCTADLVKPTIQAPAKQMDVLSYSGTGAAQSVSALTFKPDLVWIKSRSGATDHALYDSLRGPAKRLESNTSDTEAAADNGLTSFDVNGFSLGDLAQVNTSAAQYVAWCWKAGNNSAVNSDGSLASTVSVNPRAGFAVVSADGISGTASLGHGLGKAPAFILGKSRTNASPFWAYHHSLGAGQSINLASTDAAASRSTWQNTPPTDTLIYPGNGDFDGDAVFYCWAEIAGYSAFGSYTGNGAANGPFVSCGFRPRLVMIKRIDVGGHGWDIHDTRRDPGNPASLHLRANDATVEASLTAQDVTATGFKLRSSDGNYNASAGTYIYAAFAEYPLGGQKTVPAKAR